ncbi:MAG: SPOR domain-containing protein [Ignavibacteria bacterium]|nr:SPOR domain-containing protein [Ignavibacteria bacterium]
MKSKTSILLILLLFTCYFSFSQSEKIKEYLKMVDEGKITEVKLALPDLLAEYPNDPGVQFLHASVLDDASKAVEIYEKIIRTYPQSEYADECYWRIIQYYALKGEVERASRELENYKKAFPNSLFITPASDLVRTAINISKYNPTRLKSSKKEEPSKDPMKDVSKDISKETPKEVQKTEPPKKGTFGLQVGLYSTIESAKAEVERFKSMRLRADIFTKQIDSITMYAVVIGDYPTREKAEAEKPIVQAKCGCNPIIFQK